MAITQPLSDRHAKPEPENALPTFDFDGSRVLMVNKYLYARGGAEQYMLQLASLLTTEGAECRFFGMDDPDNTVPQDAVASVAPYMDLASPPRGLHRLRVAARLVYSNPARQEVRRLVRRERFDIAHVHNIYHQMSPSVLAPLQKMPVVMTVHDYKLMCPVYSLVSHGKLCEECIDSGSFLPAVRHRCNRGSLAGSALVAFETDLHRRLGLYRRGVDVFVAPSDFVRGRLVKVGYPADRVVTLPNFAAVPDTPEVERGDAFLYVGRLSAEKGADVLIKAAANGASKVRIAGDGPQRGELETLATKLGADVTFLGYLSRAEVSSELAQARAVVLPSVVHENCPLSVMEAMWAGTPVIASDVGGVPGIIRDGSDGVIVPHNDPAALSRAIAGMDPLKAASIGLRARDRARQEFTASRHLEGIAEAYALATSIHEDRTRR